jgi:small basic protein
MIAAIALVIGVLLGIVFRPTVPLWLEPYLPIAVVAALDAVFGGVRARLDGIFVAKVFVVSFVSNVLVAALIVFMGDKLGVGGQLSTAVVVVLGIRIFGNAAAIRRHLFRARDCKPRWTSAGPGRRTGSRATAGPGPRTGSRATAALGA